MNDVIYLLCKNDDDGIIVGDLDCFYDNPIDAIRDAVRMNLDIIKNEYTNELLLFLPGYGEDCDDFAEYLLDYHKEEDAMLMAVHFAMSYINNYNSRYPYLYMAVPIEKHS